DKEKNIKHRAEDVIITKPNSKTTVMIITTNEELVIAKDTLRIIKEKGLL
ncbi:MAG: acetate kinase, partial [Bacteroidales bacterium]|nr:acetate kinase [Bacteroidales bacterium]